MVAAVVLAMVAAAQPKSECTCAKKAEGTHCCDSTRSSLACGANSKGLAASVGDDLPLDTERGYHLTYQWSGGVATPPPPNLSLVALILFHIEVQLNPVPWWRAGICGAQPLAVRAGAQLPMKFNALRPAASPSRAVRSS